VRSENIDKGERLCLLTTYKDCLREKCKATTKQASDLREAMKDDILETLCLKRKPEKLPTTSEDAQVCIDISVITCPTMEELENMPSPTQEVDIDKILLEERVTKDTVYKICGYLLYTRRRLLKCKECLPTLQTAEELLPADFYHHCLTDIKTKGGFKYCTPPMFNFFHAVETIYKKEVNQNNLSIGNWFQRVMSKLCKGKINIEFCCNEQHKLELIPDLVMEYFVIRNHFETNT
jgi:hypothetical protein